MNVAEAARRLNVCERTIYRMCVDGQLSFQSVPRGSGGRRVLFVSGPMLDIRHGLLTVREAAERLKLSERGVYTLCYKGHLKYQRVGKGRRLIGISPADLAACIKARKESVVDPGGLSVRQAAHRLKTTPRKVYVLCETGKLKCSRVGEGRGLIRIDADDIAAYLKAREKAILEPTELSVRRAARRLGVCCRVLYNWINSGRIKAHRVGDGHRWIRIAVADVDEYLRQRSETR